MDQIKIVYEDQNLIIIDKPAGWVIHEGAGEHADVIVDWFLAKYPKTKNLNWPEPTRAGVIHRLDKDTSGLLILAKTPKALDKMQALFQNHEIKKTYQTLVFGKLDKNEGEISGFIGRDPHARRQQISQSIHFDFQPGAHRQSRTFYKVIKEYKYKNYDLTLVEATLETGRMHQIRVHFKSIGCPVIGDPIYNIKHSRIVSKNLGLVRQFLHAHKLTFTNPFDGKIISAKSDLSDELKKVILELQ